MNPLARIFNHEPVVYVGLIQSVLYLLLSFHLLAFIGLNTQDDLALLVTVLAAAGAIATAYKTDRTWLAPTVEFTKAVVAFLVIYKIQLTTEQTGGIIAVLNMIAAFLHQGQVTPLSKGSFKTE